MVELTGQIGITETTTRAGGHGAAIPTVKHKQSALPEIHFCNICDKVIYIVLFRVLI